MVIQKNCEFVANANTPIVSKPFPNAVGDILTLQVSGAHGVFHIEGRNNKKGDWVSLAAVNLSDFSAVRNGITKPGLYELSVVGVRELRARVESVEGNVTIFGQIISTEET